MARPTKVIVGPGDDAWTVSVEGGGDRLATATSKEEAIRLGRSELDRLGGGELELRRRDGTIEEAWTLGAPENLRSPG